MHRHCLTCLVVRNGRHVGAAGTTALHDSGAYMPAVTYRAAAETMSEHGDDVIDYIDHNFGDVTIMLSDHSWDGLACHLVSTAVELWASAVESTMDDELGSYEYEEPGCVVDGVRGLMGVRSMLAELVEDDSPDLAETLRGEPPDDLEDMDQAVQALQDKAAPWITIEFDSGSVVASVRPCE